MTTGLTRRTLVSASAAGTALLAGARFASPSALAAYPAILKPTPADTFVDFNTNAEMRWDSVDPRKYLTDQSRLFVRNHTVTPTIDKTTWRLKVFGDGLATARTEAEALSLAFDDLRALPIVTHESVHECTGNGRSFFASQQAQTVSGTSWKLGAVGAVVWEGVRLRDLLRRIGISPDAVSIQAAGLDPEYSTGGTNYGRVRRPFPVSKALDDAILAWGANGKPLLPDHGYPLRLVLPGWVGIASIKWLGSLEVSNTVLTSPWNTKWYRLSGGSYPSDSPPLTVNPVRSAWELPFGATLARGRRTLTGRSWSGAARIRHVEVSLDGGATWRTAQLKDAARGHDTAAVRGHGWSQWSVKANFKESGPTQLLARATDRAGRTQPLTTPLNENGYFFDAVVKHAVTVV